MLHQLDVFIPVTGLELVYLADQNKWFAIATTSCPTRFYQFFGGPKIKDIFQKNSINKNHFFRELPGEIKNSNLNLQFQNNSDIPTSFMLSSEVGLYIGELMLNLSNTDDQNTPRDKLICFPKKSNLSVENLLGLPISTIATNFHYILLYESRLIILNKLTEKIVHEENINQHYCPLLSLEYDCANSTIWVVCKQNIMQLDIINEDGDAWKYYLQKAYSEDPRMFDKALQSCKLDSQRNKVFEVRGEYHFYRNEYDQAIQFFAESSCSFEKIVLFLKEVTKSDVLRKYLCAKLDRLSSVCKTQRTIITVWIVKLWLEELVSNNDTFDLEINAFHQFLSKSVSILKPTKDVIYKLISLYENDSSYLVYATENQDYERIMLHFIHHGHYDCAIETLARQNLQFLSTETKPPESFVNLYYKYSLELLLHSVESTIDAWIEASYFLDPCRLIPAIIQYLPLKIKQENDTLNMNSFNQITRYLEHCINIQKNNDESIHNLLIGYYAAGSDEFKLQQFLDNPNSCFDINYALVVCLQYEKKHACVELYSRLGLFMDAVKLALQIDPELARKYADMARDQEVYPNLWILIAQYEIKTLKEPEDIIQKALSLIKESETLSIENLLEFLPDFLKTEELKEEICSSLNKYNEKIDSLKLEINNLSKTAEKIRNEVLQYDNNFAFFRTDSTCNLCGNLVSDETFYIFPCTHTFHSSCLFSEISYQLEPAKREALTQLQESFSSSCNSESKQKKNTPKNSLFFNNPILHNETQPSNESSITQPISAIHDFLSAACPFCGEFMIQSITKPFIS